MASCWSLSDWSTTWQSVTTPSSWETLCTKPSWWGRRTSHRPVCFFPVLLQNKVENVAERHMHTQIFSVYFPEFTCVLSCFEWTYDHFQLVPQLKVLKRYFLFLLSWYFDDCWKKYKLNKVKLFWSCAVDSNRDRNSCNLSLQHYVWLQCKFRVERFGLFNRI